MKSVQTPDGATTTVSYTGNLTQVTVPGSPAQTRQTVADALGRLTQVTEDPAGLDYFTTYSYNSQSGVSSLLQMQTSQTQASPAATQTRTFLYNSRGLLTSATNPENGTVTYGYDANGNRVTRTRGSSVITYSYGLADLPSGIAYSGGASTPNVTYQYNASVPNSNGRLTSVSSSAAIDAITGYDALGRITGSSVSIAGSSPYPFTYSWNLADALISTTYPSGRVVTNVYDPANRIINVTSGTKTYLSGTCGPHGTGVCYAAHGAPASHSYGNSVARAYTYNNRLQPVEMKDTTPSLSSPLLDLQYYFGGSTQLGGNSALNNGNPTQITIGKVDSGGSPVTFTQTYGYDSLNRITAASDSGGWSENFGYDRFGNVWLSSTPAGLPAQQMAGAQSAYNAATNRLASGSYDGSANQTVLGTDTLSFDAENRVVKDTDSVTENVTTYAYDGLGQRVSKTLSGAAATLYVHDAFGNLAAEYNPPASAPCTTCYFSWDHLGSTRVVTDGTTGLAVARHDFIPFGAEVPTGYAGRAGVSGAADGLSVKFTGQDRDTETQLDFFQARYLGYGQGRFMSVDPAGDFVADFSNPQTWNRYAYVAGNPILYTDPSGLFLCSGCGGDDSGDDGDDGDWSLFGFSYFAGQAGGGGGSGKPNPSTTYSVPRNGGPGSGKSQFGTAIALPDPGHQDKCSQLLTEMIGLIQAIRASGTNDSKGLNQRYDQLSRMSKAARPGHEIQFKYRQNQLISKIKEYTDSGCGAPPPLVIEWSTKPLPAGQPGANTTTTERIDLGIGAAAGAYLLYRGLRLLPSLFPPLWPSLPITIAVP